MNQSFYLAVIFFVLQLIHYIMSKIFTTLHLRYSSHHLIVVLLLFQVFDLLLHLVDFLCESSLLSLCQFQHMILAFFLFSL